MALPILIVEDNNINSEVAVLNLRQFGFDTVVAHNGFEALELIKTQQFGLVLMDVMMPSIDGWEAARRIRELEQPLGRRTPIIGVSAWSASDNRQRCLDSGMDDYLSKPYNSATLLSVVQRWISVTAGQ